MEAKENTMNCSVLGIGAWGPGFNTWPDLISAFSASLAPSELTTTPPKPEIIPANERRRSPLPVKIAVETSWQAVQHADIAATEIACVFGSGLGDTEITDYMCRTLNTELKQLSPTKFHNSVHNAAAGYWTISTHCMKSANSIAAYHETAALALFEGISQAIYQDELMLITLFDTKAHSAYQDIFSCTQDFAAAILISPRPVDGALANLALTFQSGARSTLPELNCQHFQHLYHTNPAAKILKLLEIISSIDDTQQAKALVMPLSESSHINIEVARAE